MQAHGVTRSPRNRLRTHIPPRSRANLPPWLVFPRHHTEPRVTAGTWHDRASWPLGYEMLPVPLGNSLPRCGGVTDTLRVGGPRRRFPSRSLRQNGRPTRHPGPGSGRVGCRGGAGVHRPGGQSWGPGLWVKDVWGLSQEPGASSGSQTAELSCPAGGASLHSQGGCQGLALPGLHGNVPAKAGPGHIPLLEHTEPSRSSLLGSGSQSQAGTSVRRFPFTGKRASLVQGRAGVAPRAGRDPAAHVTAVRTHAFVPAERAAACEGLWPRRRHRPA